MRIALFFSIILIITIPASAVSLIPQDNLGYPVHITSITGEERGSGFYLLSKKGDLFLVTAKHVLFTPANELINASTLLLESIPYDESTHQIQPDEWVRITIPLSQLLADRQIKFHPTQDIALIKLENADGSRHKGVLGSISRPGLLLIQAPSQYLKPFANVNVGDDAIVYGYPSSIGLKDIPQIDKAKPLVRKGNIAWKNSKTRTIVIAVPSYPGNSGGPVAEMEYINNGQIRFDIIGVISQFVPYAHEIMARNSKSNEYLSEIDRVVLENSGYTIVTPSDVIFEVLDQF
jgi:hypothetical protein